MRLEVKDHERQVLLEDLDETLDGISEIYSRFNEGRAWNRYDPRNDHGLEILVHARDDLAVDAAPWTLEAPQRDLELLITRLRGGASLALGIGARLSEGFIPSVNVTDLELNDSRLDLMAVCDALLQRLLAIDDVST